MKRRRLSPPLQKVDVEAARRQVEKLKRIKAERDNSRVRACLGRLRQAAQGEENVMPHLIEVAKAYGSIGEITSVFKEVWGEYNEKDFSF